jgi:hypothetical protein
MAEKPPRRGARSAGLLKEYSLALRYSCLSYNQSVLKTREISKLESSLYFHTANYFQTVKPILVSIRAIQSLPSLSGLIRW